MNIGCHTNSLFPCCSASVAKTAAVAAPTGPAHVLTVNPPPMRLTNWPNMPTASDAAPTQNACAGVRVPHRQRPTPAGTLTTRNRVRSSATHHRILFKQLHDVVQGASKTAHDAGVLVVLWMQVLLCPSPEIAHIFLAGTIEHRVQTGLWAWLTLTDGFTGGNTRLCAAIRSRGRRILTQRSYYRWYNYDEGASDVVDFAFKDWRRNPAVSVRAVRSGVYTYSINFNEMQQTNIEHPNHTQRTIRRVPLRPARLSGSSLSFLTMS